MKLRQRDMRGHYSSRNCSGFLFPRFVFRYNDSMDKIIDRKWRTLISRARLFRYVPFLDFALVAGSMAMGTAREDSDFDVIVGARSGRIFTVRFASVVLFQLFGWRRKRLDHKGEARDKICLNHFVTPASYCLQPPYGSYWRMLYEKLVPIVGDPNIIERFFAANRIWAGHSCVYRSDPRHRYRKAWIVRLIERMFSNSLGDLFESFMKDMQMRRIRQSIASTISTGYRPRIIANEIELEFHPDTKRIEIFE